MRPQRHLDLVVGVVQPDGTELIETDDGGVGEEELFTVRLSQEGPHLLVIGAYESNSTGRFDIVVT